MKTVALFVGIVAVVFYLIGYLQRKRNNIILFNLTSRILYIIQYILLGAFEGAALDIAGAVASLLAQKKNTGFIKKHLRAVIVSVNICIVLIGLSLYKNVFSLLPIIAILLHTGAFWMDNEKIIRRISFLGCPFWLVYNFVSYAYGSCVGDLLSMVSIAVSMVRYDYKRSAVNNEKTDK